MATINWANPVNGTFSIAADWAGGTAPGANDTAVIAVAPALKYESYIVQLNTAVTLGGLVLNQKHATLSATGNITAGTVAVEAGRLSMQGASLNAATALSGGVLSLTQGALSGSLDISGGVLRTTQTTLNGTVTYTAGAVQFGAGTTLNNVIWRGELSPSSTAPLVIKTGLTLTGANGSGPGTAAFAGAVTLDGVASLDNATITMFNTGFKPNLTVTNTASLTLGSALTLVDAAFKLAGATSLINDGTLTGSGGAGAGIIGGHVTNNGAISGNFSESALSFTNNGAISAGANQAIGLALAGLQHAGSHGSITLAGGDLLLTASLTTSQLQALYTAQHITTSGANGFGLVGTLTNTGATLNIGTGTTLGTLYAAGDSTIIGGAIIDHGGEQAGTVTLNNATYTSTTGRVALGTDSWTNVALTGASALSADDLTLNGGTLTGLGSLTIAGNLTLNGTDITGVANSGKVSVDFTSALTNMLTLGAGQSVAGYSFTFGDPATYNSGEVLVAGGLTLDNTSFAFISGPGNAIVDSSATQGITFGHDFTATISNGDLDLLGQGAAAAIANQGTITVQSNLLVGDNDFGVSGSYTTTVDNSGLIAVGAGGTLYIDPTNGHLTNTGTILVNGGTLEASVADLANHGTVTVTNGTLVLDGPLVVGDLNRISDPGSALDIAGTVSLGGHIVTPGSNGVQAFSLLGGTITDGTLQIGAGHSFSAVTTGDVVTPVIDAALNNNGTLTATLDPNADVDQSQLEITGAVTGSGTISFVSGGAGSFQNFCTVKLDGSVAAGQHLSFTSGYDELEFANKAAIVGFAGKLDGLDSGGNVETSFQFDTESIKSAAVQGHDILIAFTDGTSVSLLAGAALTGSVSFFNSGGNGMLQYNRATPSHPGTSLTDTLLNEHLTAQHIW